MLPTVDLIRVGAFVGGSLLLCTLRLRIILWADAIYSMIAGSFMIYYSGETLNEAHKKTTDIQHQFLLCSRVILQLMPAFTWILCRNSVDITCRTAVTLSRLVSYAGSAIVMAIEHTRIGFTDFHLMYCLLPCCLWSMVMGVQLVRTGSRVNIHIRMVDINMFLRVDLLLLLLSALLDLAAPAFVGQYLGRQVDPLHAYLHRINGCVFLGLANIPWIGQRYRYAEDKHTILLARVLSLLIWFGGMGFGIQKKLIPMNLSAYASLGQMGLLFLPSLVGIIICQNGPFTPAFWSSQRRTVQINQQSQQPQVAPAPGPGSPPRRM